MTQENLYSGTLLQCLLGNSDPSASDPIATAPSPVLSELEKGIRVGIGDKNKKSKILQNSTPWYIKIVVTKLFEGKAHYLFYWLKPTSQKKKNC